MAITAAFTFKAIDSRSELDSIKAEFPTARIVGAPHGAAYALLEFNRLSIVLRRPKMTPSGGVWVTPGGQEFESLTFAISVALERPSDTMRRAASRPAPEVGPEVHDYFERLRAACKGEMAPREVG